MITRIAHICLNTKNLTASLHFYEEILRLKRKFTFRKQGICIGAYLEVSDRNFIEIFEKPDLEVVNTGITHLCLETDNIDEMIVWLKSHNVSFTEKKIGCDQSYQIWVEDPDKNHIEIHEYTPNSSQLTGKDADVNW
jgi:lactoylglutathione lyase/glyoxylase I family protein